MFTFKLRYLRMFQAMSGRNIGLLQVAIEMANPEVVGLLLEEGAEVGSISVHLVRSH